MLIALTKHQPSMRVELDVEQARIDGLALGQLVDQRAIHIHGDHARVELVDRNAAALVGFRPEPERVGANSKIRIHRDEYEGPIGLLVLKVECHLQDESVHLSWARRSLGHLGRHGNAKLATGAFERHTLIERAPVLIAQLVENARKVSRVLPELAELFFELIDLFDDEDR